MSAPHNFYQQFLALMGEIHQNVGAAPLLPMSTPTNWYEEMLRSLRHVASQTGGNTGAGGSTPATQERRYLLANGQPRSHPDLNDTIGTVFTITTLNRTQFLVMMSQFTDRVSGDPIGEPESHALSDTLTEFVFWSETQIPDGTIEAVLVYRSV